ncbi:TetR/AcrR family transcriptional regulator [Nocardioides sp. NPDC058538]|uniref:TetR/AcrR family transcriptional regulator n=1 Tax=Nocardioides sp. NPDC058538 TaxID=3346542 RepID=UPI00365CE3E6
MTDPAVPIRTRKRQARGEERMREIVRAAAVVFAERGPEAATTNAIAAEAGISPGSLYQFFSSKADIARALSEHYAAELSGVRQTIMDVGQGTSIEASIDAVVGPLVAFSLARPGFKALFARSDLPADMREAVAPVQQAMHQTVATLIARFMTERDPADVDRIATVAIQIVRGMMPLITEAPDPASRDALMAELRTALAGYLNRA